MMLPIWEGIHKEDIQEAAIFKSMLDTKLYIEKNRLYLIGKMRKIVRINNGAKLKLLRKCEILANDYFSIFKNVVDMLAHRGA